jgi:predicted metal-dependent hydrolase/pimeloyl-ACP methyl ester carboxylesterase
MATIIEHSVSGHGGVNLAVREWPKAEAPTVVLVHGYPDNQNVWNAVAPELNKQFRVITYDVRGAGESDKPRQQSAYKLNCLSADFHAVIEQLSPDAPVHVLAHDWGSIQSWESVTEEGAKQRIASYSSISGPSLDHIGFWARDQLRPSKLTAGLSQLLHSWYVAAFHVPVLGELAWRGVVGRAWPRLLKHVEGFDADKNATQTSDGLLGMKLYRANVLPQLQNPRRRFTEVPVQLLIPEDDHFVTKEMARACVYWAPNCWQRDLVGGHWSPVSHAKQVAKAAAEFVTFVEKGCSPRSTVWRKAKVEVDARAKQRLQAASFWGPFKQEATGSTTHYDITPRRVNYDWQNTPLEWIPNQPFTSHFVNEINLLLPAGEFWFCRLFNKAMPHITDEKLKKDVKAFVRQEAQHAQAHSSATEDYLQAHGIKTKQVTSKIDWVLKVVGADQPFGYKVPKRLEHQWLVLRLGLVATIEHMTCVLGEYIVENQIWQQQGADPTLLDLLKWHGAEEIEHRSVAFDVYRHLGGTYISRYYLSAIVFPVIIGLWADGAANIMAQDPRFAGKKPGVFRPWFWREWSRQAKQGNLPSVGFLAKKHLAFFNPWYDPVDEGDTEKALALLAENLGYQNAGVKAA